jgi:hypothetical protein
MSNVTATQTKNSGEAPVKISLRLPQVAKAELSIDRKIATSATAMASVNSGVITSSAIRFCFFECLPVSPALGVGTSTVGSGES